MMLFERPDDSTNINDQTARGPIQEYPEESDRPMMMQALPGDLLNGTTDRLMEDVMASERLHDIAHETSAFAGLAAPKRGDLFAGNEETH